MPKNTIEQLKKEKEEILNSLNEVENNKTAIEDKFLTQNTNWWLYNRKHYILTSMILLFSIIAIVSIYGMISTAKDNFGNEIFVLNFIIFFVLLILITGMIILWVINFKKRLKLKKIFSKFDKKFSKNNLLIRLKEIEDKIKRHESKD